MSFKIREQIVFTHDGWVGEDPNVVAEKYVIATWDAREGLPSFEEVMDAVTTMRAMNYPPEKQRIMGLPKPGDKLLGVEVA